MNTNIIIIISFNSRTNKAWEGLQKERESSISKSKAWERVTGKSTGNKGLIGASKAWKGL
jgi:hypothetical protein